MSIHIAKKSSRTQSSLKNKALNFIVSVLKLSYKAQNDLSSLALLALLITVNFVINITKGFLKNENRTRSKVGSEWKPQRIFLNFTFLLEQIQTRNIKRENMCVSGLSLRHLSSHCRLLYFTKFTFVLVVSTRASVDKDSSLE